MQQQMNVLGYTILIIPNTNAVESMLKWYVFTFTTKLKGKLRSVQGDSTFDIHRSHPPKLVPFNWTIIRKSCV